MANTRTDSSLELLNVIKRVADKIGIANLKTHLTKLERASVTATDEELQNATIKEVCLFLGIAPKSLKSQDSEKTEQRYWAIVYISVILRNRLKTPFPVIALLFQLKPQTIRNKVNQFKNLSPQNTYDKKRLLDYEKINTELDNKKIFAKHKN